MVLEKKCKCKGKKLFEVTIKARRLPQKATNEVFQDASYSDSNEVGFSAILREITDARSEGISESQ